MQAESAIKKGANCFQILNISKKIPADPQFLKAVSAHVFDTVFYACAVWYDNIKSLYKNMLCLLHY